MLSINTEDDCLLKPVATLLQELRYLSGDQLGAIVEHQHAVEVFGVVNAVLDHLAFAVKLTLLWSKALYVTVDMNFDHLVWREEPIANALFQGIGVNRRSKIID